MVEAGKSEVDPTLPLNAATVSNSAPLNALSVDISPTTTTVSVPSTPVLTTSLPPPVTSPTVPANYSATTLPPRFTNTPTLSSSSTNLGNLTLSRPSNVNEPNSTTLPNPLTSPRTTLPSGTPSVPVSTVNTTLINSHTHPTSSLTQSPNLNSISSTNLATAVSILPNSMLPSVTSSPLSTPVGTPGGTLGLGTPSYRPLNVR